jgi:hypothetical protein
MMIMNVSNKRGSDVLHTFIDSVAQTLSIDQGSLELLLAVTN